MNINSDLDETTSDPNVIAPVLQSSKTTSINSKDWISSFDINLGDFGGYQHTSPELRLDFTTLDENKRIKTREVNGFLKVQYDYDANGRIEKISKGSGVDERATLFTYYSSGPMNGELQTITNPVGHSVTFEYDSNGRVIKQMLPDTSEIRYSYDANDNLISLTPPSKPSHVFEYNGMNQETQYTAPSIVGVTIPETKHEYNLDQQLTKTIRPDGTESVNTYNVLTGNLETITIPSGMYSYSYDLTSGKLNQISSPDGVILNYEFDGFLPTKTTWSGTISGNVSRTYDFFFRVDSRTINGTETVEFSYDDDNLLIQAGDLIISREAQIGGLINGTSIGNISTSIDYNNFGEVISREAKYSATTINSISYTRDKLGRISTNSEIENGITTNFEYKYDLSGSLSEVKINGVTTKTWDYDSNNNLTHENGILIATYDNQDRLRYTRFHGQLIK